MPMTRNGVLAAYQLFYSLEMWRPFHITFSLLHCRGSFMGLADYLVAALAAFLLRKPCLWSLLLILPTEFNVRAGGCCMHKLAMLGITQAIPTVLRNLHDCTQQSSGDHMVPGIGPKPATCQGMCFKPVVSLRTQNDIFRAKDHQKTICR